MFWKGIQVGLKRPLMLLCLCVPGPVQIFTCAQYFLLVKSEHRGLWLLVLILPCLVYLCVVYVLHVCRHGLLLGCKSGVRRWGSSSYAAERCRAVWGPFLIRTVLQPA